MTKLFTTAKLMPGTKTGEEQTLHIESAYGSYTITQQQLIDLLIEDGQMCEDCYDEGEVSTDEPDGEGNTMRGVGSQKCHCKMSEGDSDDREDDRDDLQ